MPIDNARGLSVRVALSTAAAMARLARRAGLIGNVKPLAMLRFARDSLLHRSNSGAAILHLHALGDPARPAVVSVPPLGSREPEQRLSYGELDARVNLLAHGLRREGAAPGERVALYLRNGIENLEVSAAINHLHAVTVLVGNRLKAPEVAFILKNSGARVMVFHGEFAKTVEAALAELGPGAPLTRERCFAVGGAPGFADYRALLAGGDPAHPPKVTAEENGGTMIYTSGTTGKPKGARREIDLKRIETVIHFMAELPLRHDERHLVVCPLYHSAATAFSLLTWSIGGCLVVLEHFEPLAVLRAIERERITSTMMVPTMLQRLVDVPGGMATLRSYDLSSLRCIVSGAAPLPTELARRVEDAFGPILYNFYGATETGFVTLARPGEHTARPGTIGRIVGGNEIRILGEDGKEVDEGAVGEIYVRSRMLMEGYHGDESATEKSLREGFVSVGDLGRRDADGYYYLSDRKSDMVISGGVNIYPLEVEQRLHEHPGIVEVAVVGVPDPDWGESLVAFVVARAGATLTVEGLRAFVAETLADFKRPKRVIFVDELPRTATGKVLKRELRQRAQ